MTLAAYEGSQYQNRPIELFYFTRGSLSWRLTSFDTNVTHDSQVYTASAIDRSDVEQSPDLSRLSITVTVPADSSLVTQYIPETPSAITEVTILRKQSLDPDSEAWTAFYGRISNVSFVENRCELRCEPTSVSLKRPMLRRIYQPNCPRALYSADCGVNAAAYAETLVLSKVSEVEFTNGTLDTFGANYFLGGYLEWASEGILKRRFIVNHVGQNVTVSLGLVGVPSSFTATLYPGCTRLMNICDTRFNNLPNFGGFPWTPSKNPMGGDPIF